MRKKCGTQQGLVGCVVAWLVNWLVACLVSCFFDRLLVTLMANCWQWLFFCFSTWVCQWSTALGLVSCGKSVMYRDIHPAKRLDENSPQQWASYPSMMLTISNKASSLHLIQQSNMYTDVYSVYRHVLLIFSLLQEDIYIMMYIYI